MFEHVILPQIHFQNASNTYASKKKHHEKGMSG
jgi:hypothetical protein